jgi:hypothetical protein
VEFLKYIGEHHMKAGMRGKANRFRKVLCASLIGLLLEGDLPRFSEASQLREQQITKQHQTVVSEHSEGFSGLHVLTEEKCRLHLQKNRKNEHSEE